MAKTHARKKQTTEHRRPQLRAITGGKAAHPREKEGGEEAGVPGLFTGRVRRTTEGTKRPRREPAPREIPRELQPIANLFAAGRIVEKEIKFKADYAKQEIDEFCVRDFARRYIAEHRRPVSADYIANHARFKFVMTTRTTMNVGKVDALKSMNIPIEEHTELRDLQINYSAIRQHGLEKKLIEALETMHIPQAVLNECFSPKVELKATFYDLLLEVVRTSLNKDEELEDKMVEVLRILGPAEQIRNTEALGLDARACFDLVYRSKVEASEDLEEEEGA